MSLGNKEIFGNNLQRYMNERNISRHELCQRLNLKYSTVTDWINGNTYPRIDKIELLANFFNINKSNLVETPDLIRNVSIDEQVDKFTKNVLEVINNNSIANDHIAIVSNILDRYEAKEGTPEELMKELHERINQLIHTK